MTGAGWSEDSEELVVVTTVSTGDSSSAEVVTGLPPFNPIK